MQYLKAKLHVKLTNHQKQLINGLEETTMRYSLISKKNVKTLQ